MLKPAKIIINGQSVTSVRATETMDILKIDGDDKTNGAELQQVYMGQGRIVISGKAWDEQQKNLIQRTFPNLKCRPEFQGAQTWLFRSE
jgi:hypothetical protein